MKIELLEEGAVVLGPFVFALFVFFIPISPTLKSVFLWISMGFILIPRVYRQHLITSFNSLWGRTSVALFLFIAIASLWSPAPYTSQAIILSKYCKLIYFPILVVGFIHSKARIWSLNSFLVAMLLTAVLSILKAYGIMTFGSFSDPGDVFYNHIATSFMIAYASYLSGLFALQNNGWLRIFYLFLFFLTSYQIFFINTGRTGNIIYCILISLLLIQKFSLKQAVLGLAVFCASVILCYNLSTTMQISANNVIREVKLFHNNNKATSLGYRIEFQQYAKSIVTNHPLFGLGTGGFKYQFALDNPVPQWGRDLTDPHSQYWMILAEQGLIGFTLLIIFLGSLFVTSLRLKETKPILQGLLIIFFIGCISDTILCFSAIGYLLITVSALCIGELLEETSEVNQRSKASLPSCYAL